MLYFTSSEPTLQLDVCTFWFLYPISPFRQRIKKQRHYFANKGPSSQGYDFSSSHVWMWELDHKECWVLKNWCFWTVVLEKTLESPLDCKGDQGDQDQEILIRRSVLNIQWRNWCWSSNTLATWCKELTHWKRPWCWERLKAEGEGDNRDEMVGWHHQLNDSGVGDGQGGLECCSP